MTWTQAQLKDWLQQHTGAQVRLEQHGGGLRIQGTVLSVEEVDLCGRLLTEISLHATVAGLEIVLTLHQERVGIQVAHQSTGETTLNFALDAPYERLTATEVLG